MRAHFSPPASRSEETAGAPPQFTFGAATSGWEIGVQELGRDLVVIGIFDHVLEAGARTGEIAGDSDLLSLLAGALLPPEATWLVRANRLSLARVSGSLPWSRGRRQLRAAGAAWRRRWLDDIVLAAPPAAHATAVEILAQEAEGWSTHLRFLAPCTEPPHAALACEQELPRRGLLAWFERQPLPILAVNDGHAYAACPAASARELLDALGRLGSRLGLPLAADRHLDASPFDGLPT